MHPSHSRAGSRASDPSSNGPCDLVSRRNARMQGQPGLPAPGKRTHWPAATGPGAPPGCRQPSTKDGVRLAAAWMADCAQTRAGNKHRRGIPFRQTDLTVEVTSRCFSDYALLLFSSSCVTTNIYMVRWTSTMRLLNKHAVFATAFLFQHTALSRLGVARQDSSDAD